MGPFMPPDSREIQWRFEMNGKKKITDQVVAASRAKAAHRLRSKEYLQPQGPDEQFLVDQITSSWWKLGITKRLHRGNLRVASERSIR